MICYSFQNEFSTFLSWILLYLIIERKSSSNLNNILLTARMNIFLTAPVPFIHKPKTSSFLLFFFFVLNIDKHCFTVNVWQGKQSRHNWISCCYFQVEKKAKKWPHDSFSYLFMISALAYMPLFCCKKLNYKNPVGPSLLKSDEVWEFYKLDRSQLHYYWASDYFYMKAYAYSGQLLRAIWNFYWQYLLCVIKDHHWELTNTLNSIRKKKNEKFIINWLNVLIYLKKKK